MNNYILLYSYMSAERALRKRIKELHYDISLAKFANDDERDKLFMSLVALREALYDVTEIIKSYNVDGGTDNCKSV